MNILNKLTQKHLVMNKKRTIVTIIGIILSTALMVGIGLLLSTFREVMIEDIISYKGDYNARITDVSKNNISIINNNTNVKKYITRNYLGYDKINYNEEIIEYFKVYSITPKYMEHLTIVSGRLPENSKEVVIPEYLYEEYPDELKIGNTLNLSLGDRYYEDNPITDLSTYSPGEYLKNRKDYQFTIVGVIKKDYYEDNDVGCYIYTTDIDSDRMDIFITYKKVNKSYDLTKNIAKNLGIVPDSREYYQKVDYNDSLLALYGVSGYDNLIGSMASMLIIMLTLVSIACIIVIYNSFAISVMERKKQFGLFSSIGATKNQIKKTVLYEAAIVSIIGIPLGILSAYLGIYIVIFIMNNLISDAFGMTFHLSTYPTFVIIPIIFMILTIFISASIPAKKASKISPIEAIRLNDDIKIKSKKVKSPKWVKKIFGIEGDIAYKNMRRNKKKYRITVVSLFISIVLFISFSGYVSYLITGTNSYLAMPEVDIIVNYDEKLSDQTVIDSIKNNQDVVDYMEYSTVHAYTDTSLFDTYTQKYQKFLQENNYLNESDNHPSDILFIILNNDNYQTYLDLIGEKEPLPILYNNFNGIVYTSNTRKSYNLSRYDHKAKEINILKENYDKENDKLGYTNLFKISNYYLSDNKYIGLGVFDEIQEDIIIISKDMALNYGLINETDQNRATTIHIKAPKYQNIDALIEKYQTEGNTSHIYYFNIKEEMKMTNNLITAIKILVYGFITLVTLIGITSVFNTINTSIALRRKEFAVLRSIGLTPHGFNKLLRFESLFFGLKSLLYALPVSFGIIYLMHLSMRNIVEIDMILIPWKSILMAIILVFVVIAISMTYATRKIKKENILDAIREENI
ncbi:MAG: ABC transporter permease [Bacilli bacterium]